MKVQAVVLALLVIAVGTAQRGRGVVPAPPASPTPSQAGTTVSSSETARPTPLPIPIRRAVPWYRFSAEVSRFVAAHDSDFHDPRPMTYHGPAGLQCEFQVRVAKNARNIPPRADSTNGYVVALFTAPNGCTVGDFTMARGRTAAWFVHFENVSHEIGSPRRGVGEAGLILLAADTSRVLANDKWLIRRNWLLGYCAHPYTAYATDSVQLIARGSTCVSGPAPSNGGEDSSEPHEGAMPFFFDPSSLWFACGGDCCWTSLF